MKLNDVIKAAQQVLQAVSRHDGKNFRLKDVDPGDTRGLSSEDKPRAKEALQPASRRWPSCRTCSTRRTAGRVLLVFQAMDAAGKDGAIKHVMSRRQSAGLPGLLVQGPVVARISITTTSGAA